MYKRQSILSSPSRETSTVETESAVLPMLSSNSEMGHEATGYASKWPKSASHSREMRADNALSTTELKSKKRSKHKQHKFATIEMTIQRTRDIILSMLEHR